MVIIPSHPLPLTPSWTRPVFPSRKDLAIRDSRQYLDRTYPISHEWSQNALYKLWPTHARFPAKEHPSPQQEAPTPSSPWTESQTPLKTMPSLVKLTWSVKIYNLIFLILVYFSVCLIRVMNSKCGLIDFILDFIIFCQWFLSMISTLGQKLQGDMISIHAETGAIK